MADHTPPGTTNAPRQQTAQRRPMKRPMRRPVRLHTWWGVELRLGCFSQVEGKQSPPTPSCLHPSILGKEVGVSALGSRRRAFIVAVGLHSSGVITEAASCGKQTYTSTNYSSFPQWVGHLPVAPNTVVTLANNEQGKPRESISSVQINQRAGH